MRLTLAIVFCALAATPAIAQNTSWHATAAGDVGVTDNVYGAPLGNRDGDLFFQLRPGFLVARNAPRMVHELAADAEIVHYAFNSRVPSLSGRTGWRALFLTGPRSEVLMSANLGSGILTALSSRLTADETAINVTPASKVTYVQADASQSFAYVLTRELRFTQSLFARWNESDDNADELELDPPMENTLTKSAEAGGSFGLQRAFRSDALSIDVGASVQRFQRLAPDTAVMGPRLDRQVSPRGRVAWSHDINRRLSFNLDGGVVFVYPFGKDPDNPEPRRSGVYPILGGTLALNEVWGRGTMSLRRDVSPNLFLAQNTVNTSATIAAAVPLPWLDDSRRRAPKLIGLGSVSVQRTQIIDPVSGSAGGLESSIGSARIDAAVAYTPKPGVAYTVRYELMYQTGDDQAAVEINGFFRNTVYFTFSLRYPDQVAGAVPKKRAGVRADRQDLAPVGSEPVVPDLLEEGEGGDER